MAYPMTVHRLVAQASMVLAMGALAFGCASGSETAEDLPPPTGDTGEADGSVAEDAPIDSADTGGEVATDTGPGGCKTNADCASDPAGKFCLPSTDGGKSYCVPCLPAPFDECGPGTYCNDTTYTCESGCKTTADCKPTTGGDAGADGGADADEAGADAGSSSLTCDTVKHRCVGCVADPDCPSGFICDRPAGACVPGCTLAKPCPTGKDCCSGLCFDTQKDVKNCGACGFACPTPSNATAGCTAGVCGIGMCNTGFGDCNSSLSDGCETNTQTNKDNCGGCGTVCTLANATAGCTAGACTIATCNGGYADCDVIASTGCETQLNTLTNCGMCGKTCTIPNGTGDCSTGTCSVATCNTGFGDCDGIASNGCETNISGGSPGPSGTILNCGSCGTSCSVSNGTPSCVAGSCAVNSCTAPYANCNGLYSDGCETNTTVSTSHCGGCGNACSTTGGTPSCSGGMCSIACSPGFGNCDSNAANGCEKNLTTDPANCNACGSVCATGGSVLTSACTPSGTTGTCNVAVCASATYDRNKIFSDGCECAEETGGEIGNNCGAAKDLGTVAIGGTQSATGNLVGPLDADEDWYKITFSGSTCAYSPSINLSGPDVKMQVYTSCVSASPAGNFACQTGEAATNSAFSSGVTSWEFRMANPDGSARTCAESGLIDPTPPHTSGSFITQPYVVYVRVFRSAVATTCYPYTLTIGN
jgi:hypothetical protein